MAEELVSAADEGAGAAVGKELALEGIDGDDGDRRRAREVVEKFLELSKLEFGAVLDPGLFHEFIVLLFDCSR